MNNLNVAEWIIVGILSTALLIFLILGIILIVKLIKLTKQAKQILETGQSIADKADDVVDNVRSFTYNATSSRNVVLDFLMDKIGKRKNK
ncbi:MAG: hypothetical protein Q4E47_01090 [Candidatus Saccharibacteria bacterium]|nr:hypothetical protein [Candidatus Saccharibacteria bacterium]